MAQFVQVCEQFRNLPSGAMECAQFSYQQAVLLPPQAESAINLLYTGGFDKQAFFLGFGGLLTLWAIGFGVGAVVSVIRKVRG